MDRPIGSAVDAMPQIVHPDSSTRYWRQTTHPSYLYNRPFVFYTDKLGLWLRVRQFLPAIGVWGSWTCWCHTIQCNAGRRLHANCSQCKLHHAFMHVDIVIPVFAAYWLLWIFIISALASFSTQINVFRFLTKYVGNWHAMRAGRQFQANGINVQGLGLIAM